MSSLPISFFLLALITGVSSEVQLKESGPGIVRPGASFRLTCTVTGVQVTGLYAWSWIRQTPGRDLEWMGAAHKNQQFEDAGAPTEVYAPSLGSRITMSVDPSKNEISLELRSSTTADTATYYCTGAGGWNWAFDVWGPGTMVTITTATATAPSVFPLAPLNKDIGTSSDVSIGCLIKDYFPEPVSVQWNSGSITSGILAYPSIQSSSNSLFKVSNQLTIPVSSWKSGRYECNVRHASTSSSLSVTVKPWEEAKPTPPTVRVLHTSCNPDATDSNIDLVCAVSGFSPADIQIKWLGSSGPIPAETEPPRQNSSGTYSTTSTISVPQSQWMEGDSFTCEVVHPASQAKVKSKAKMCAGATSNIKVFGVRPTPMDIYVNRDPKISCVVYNLESESDLQVTWSQHNGRSLTPELLKLKDEDNGTVTATSSLALTDRDWLTGDKFICTVTHPSLPIAKQVTISKQTGPTSAPSVYLFRPHHEELHGNGQHVSITALVKGFKPSDISLIWLKDNQPLPAENFVNTPVTTDGNGSYFFYSKLTVPKAHWNRGDSFTAMTVHEALSLKFIQKSIEKSQGKK